MTRGDGFRVRLLGPCVAPTACVMASVGVGGAALSVCPQGLLLGVSVRQAWGCHKQGPREVRCAGDRQVVAHSRARGSRQPPRMPRPEAWFLRGSWGHPASLSRPGGRGARVRRGQTCFSLEARKESAAVLGWRRVSHLSLTAPCSPHASVCPLPMRLSVHVSSFEKDTSDKG